MTTEVYPYQNIGENIPLKRGKSFTELTNALARQLSSFITGTERVQVDFSVDNALGPVIDSIAKLVDVTRKSGQSDATLSGIVLNEVTTREQSTIDGLTDAINNVIGTGTIIEEYPLVDFVNDYGLSQNEGAVRVTIPSLQQEFFQDVLLQTDLYKAAGIAVVYNLLTEMTEYFDEFLPLDELFHIEVAYIEDLMTLSDNLDGFEIGLIEALTSIVEQFGIEAAFIEDTFTPLDDGDVSFEGLFYFTENMSTITDYFGGGSIDDFPLTDLFPNRPAIIGEALIDTHAVGGHWVYTEGDYWDSAIWDIAVWDSTGDVLSIKELF